MKLSRYDKIEALVSAIEDEQLRIFEANAMTVQDDQFEDVLKQRLKAHNKQKFFFFIKADLIPWRCWSLKSMNVYAHNLIFYRERLRALLEG